MIIAIDFDGTCVTHEYPKMGRDIGAVPVLKRLVEAGHHLILYTMRDGKELDSAIDWFTKNEIALLGVNENPDQKKWTESPKIYANFYIDDAALGIPLVQEFDKRPYVDWVKTKSLLINANILDQNFYIMCGLPGSGKSHYAKKMSKANNSIIINRDSYRTMISGYYKFEKGLEPLVKKMAYENLYSALENGYDVILDETNLSLKGRLKTAALVKDRYPKVKVVVVHLNTEVKTCKKRRAKDTKGYTPEKWNEVIDDMLSYYDKPSINDEFEEFDGYIKLNFNG
jgi:predicted kinase